MYNQRRRANQLQREIREKEEELSKIKVELALVKELLPHERIAVELHETLCRHNHTDGCSWHNEVKKGVHNWDGNEHKSWIKKGIRLNDFIAVNNITEEQLFEIVNLTNAY